MLITALITPLVLGVSINNVQASLLTSVSDVMSRTKALIPSNHEIKFVTPPGGGVKAGETVNYTFPVGFTLGSVDFPDIDFASGSSNNCLTATFTEKTLGPVAFTSTWGGSVSGQTITITSGTSVIAADTCIRLRVGTNAVIGGTGVNQVTNAIAGNDYVLLVAGTFSDVGSMALSIVADDQVAVTANVLPTFSFIMSGLSCELGVLSPTDIKTCNYDITTSTNAHNGYTTTIVEDGNLRTTDGGSDINDVVDGGVSVTSEEYGIGLTGSDRAFSDEQAIPNTDKIIASNSGTVVGSLVNVTHKATISVFTPAGSYSHTVTLISVGIF